MEKKIINVLNQRYRLGYHISAPSGWINDPNGFCYFKGYYHIFYQYYPYDSSWGPMHWGHARSKDLIHWETLPIALKPDAKGVDEGGCFSGSAIVKNDKLYLIYTGHHYYDDGDPEHFWENQNLAVSEDGINFSKYSNNPIISALPEDSTHHFRDPKVWEDDGIYYMVLGNQSKDGKGRAILYKSQNLFDWEYLHEMSHSKKNDTEGFMWECPDFFTLEEKDILLFSPQGVVPKGVQYLNLFQTGYFVGKFNKNTNQFDRGEFEELDFGHDFYATQTMLAPDGRRLLFAWMAMWESQMPEKQDGWAGALTFPRELKIKNKKLLMMPVREIEGLRVRKISQGTLNHEKTILLDEQTKTAEVKLTIRTSENFKFILSNTLDKPIITLTYNKENNIFELERSDRKGDNRFSKLSDEIDIFNFHILLDTSSLETFINDGEVVFTERFYSEEKTKLLLETQDTITSKSFGEYESYELDNNVIDREGGK